MLSRFSLKSVCAACLLLACFAVNAKSNPLHTSDTRSGDSAQHIKQYVSQNHVTGFKPDGMYIAGMDHHLGVEFIGANKTVPASSTPNSTQIVQQLHSVTYSNLWDGINLAYDRGNGIVRSTYTLVSGANPGDIALQYSASFDIQQDGSLLVEFESGSLTESAPIAWQEIDGHHTPVKVAFVAHSENHLGFEVGEYDSNQPLIIDPTIAWLTFIGAADSADESYAIETDADNNIYIAGHSTKKWGTPVGTSSNNGGTLVAKLNSAGVLQWHTFVVSGSIGSARGLALNGSGDIWITGTSTDTWGPNPINDHTRVKNGADYNGDIWVAKLNSSGELQWNTFHGHAPIEFGSNGSDSGYDIVVDSSGNSYVTGTSNSTWPGNPNVHNGATSNGNSKNIVVFKLDADGALGWNGFYGGGISQGRSIAISRDSTLYVAGYNFNQWGSPIDSMCDPNPLCDRGQAIVIKLNTTGYYWWHTYLGKTSWADSIATDSLGNAFISGYATSAIAGEPIRPYTSASDILVTKLNQNGIKQWHTYLGGTGADLSKAITVSDRSIYVAGDSGIEWGTPLNAHLGKDGEVFQHDIMVAELDLNGELRHHTFVGSTASENAEGAAVDTNNDLIVTGSSPAAWPDSAINAYSSGTEVDEIFVAKMDLPLMGEIEVYGQSIRIENGDVTPTPDDDTEFGSVYAAGEVTISRNFTIKNVGTGALLLDGAPLVEIVGTHPSDFTVTSLPSTPITSQGDTEFEITFDPTAEGVRTATISIESNHAAESPFLFDVQGTGNPPSPEIEILGGHLGTALIPDGKTGTHIADGTQFDTLYSGIGGSDTHTFNISNVGTADLNLTGVPMIEISGANAADYTVTTLPDTPVDAAGMTSFEIKYELATPATQFELRNATVTVANNDDDENPYTFNIIGLASNSNALGGTLSGLAPGNSIVLENTDGRTFQKHELLLESNGAFVFDPRYAVNSPYTVVILSLPDNPAQECNLINGEGYLTTDITNIEVSCIPLGFTVGGTVSGLEGEGLVMQLNDANNLAVTADGSFTFPLGLDDAAAYEVSIFSQPVEPGQECTLSSNSGNIASANVDNVTLTCVTPDLISSDSFEEPETP